MSALDRVRDAFSSLFVSKPLERELTAPMDAPSDAMGNLVSLFGPDGSLQGLPLSQSYRYAVVVYACVNRIAYDLAARPMEWYVETASGARNKVQRQPGNVVDVMARGGARTTGFAMRFGIYAHTAMAGAAYLHLNRGAGDSLGRIAEINLLPPGRVTPKLGEDGVPFAYDYFNGRATVRFAADQVVEVQRFIPDNEVSGMSDLEPAALAVRTRMLMGGWNLKFYQLGAMVAGYFSPTGNLTPDQIDRSEAKLKKRQGLARAFDPVVLGGLKYERAGITQKEMAFVESAQWTDGDVCRAFDVPPSLIGIKEGGSFTGESGFRVDLERYVMTCLQPRAAWIDAVLTENLGPHFGTGLLCETEFRSHPAIAARRLELAKGVVPLVNTVLTRNEARAEVGYEPTGNAEDDEIQKPDPPVIDPSAQDAPQDKPKEKHAGAARHPRGGRSNRPTGRVAPAFRQRQEDANRARFEPSFARTMRRVFSAQEKRVLAALDESGLGARAALEFDRLLNASKEDEASVRRILRRIVNARGREAMADVGATGWARDAARVISYVERHTARCITETTKTTQGRIREAIAEGVQRGENLSELAARVRSVFDDRRENVVTIARTEVHAAYSWSTLEGWNQSDVVVGKQWVTAGDELVRMAHSEAEAVGEIPLDEPWTMQDEMGNTVEMMAPGDVGAPPELVINCRCFLDPVLASDVTDPDAMEGDSWQEWWHRNSTNGSSVRVPAAVGGRMSSVARPFANGAVMYSSRPRGK